MISNFIPARCMCPKWSTHSLFLTKHVQFKEQCKDPFTWNRLRPADPPAQRGSLHWCWAGRWQVRVRFTMQSGQTQPTLLYGAVRWKWTACLFLSDCHPIWSVGRMAHVSPSICFWWSGSDQMLAGEQWMVPIRSAWKTDRQARSEHSCEKGLFAFFYFILHFWQPCSKKSKRKNLLSCTVSWNFTTPCVKVVPPRGSWEDLGAGEEARFCFNVCMAGSQNGLHLWI